MANNPNQKKTDQANQDPAKKPGQAATDQGKQKSGHEVQSPSIHRTDTKDATMGRPGSGGRDPNRRDEGETQTQETEFANESDGANIDEPRAANRPGQNQSPQGRTGETTGKTGQNQGGQGQMGQGAMGQDKAGKQTQGGQSRNA